jgi:hypothetical protein
MCVGVTLNHPRSPLCYDTLSGARAPPARPLPLLVRVREWLGATSSSAPRHDRVPWHAPRVTRCITRSSITRHQALLLPNTQHAACTINRSLKSPQTPNALTPLVGHHVRVRRHPLLPCRVARPRPHACHQAHHGTGSFARTPATATRPPARAAAARPTNQQTAWLHNRVLRARACVPGPSTARVQRAWRQAVSLARATRPPRRRQHEQTQPAAARAAASAVNAPFIGDARGSGA